MAQIAEIILDGSYTYFNKDVIYSQENFKLVSIKESQSVHLYSEILSRIETGEFLKILVRYEMNAMYIPTLVRIEKSLGSKFAFEVYKIDASAGELHYSFQNSAMSQEFTRTFNTKHYIATPAFATSAIFNLTKKLDINQWTPVTLISTDNDWTYDGPPKEKVVYVEVRPKEKTDYLFEKQAVDTTILHLHENATREADQDTPVEIILSKEHSIPYQMNFGDQKIVVKKFKKMNDDQILK